MGFSCADIVARAWEQTMRESPAIEFGAFLWGQQPTYRERLDKQPKNWHGELIPRIVTVRRHLRFEMNGNPRLDPKRLPT